MSDRIDGMSKALRAPSTLRRRASAGGGTMRSMHLRSRSGAGWGLLALAALAAAGCGGAQGAGPGASPTTTSTPPPATVTRPPVISTVTVSSTVTTSTDSTGTPPIVVSAPTSGASVASPIAFSGTADVFEGTVSIQLRGSDGSVLASRYVTASCGSGCRGSFSGHVAAPAGYHGAATLRFFESSAEDGSQLHVVEVPVTVA
jgi:hypothetical protein